MATSGEHQQPWYLRSSAPVLFPTHDGFDLSLSPSAFSALIQDIVRSEATAHKDDMEVTKSEKTDKDDSLTSAGAAASHETLEEFDLTTRTEIWEEGLIESDKPEESQNQSDHPFIQGLLSHNPSETMPQEDMQNKMLTENADVAYRSTKSPLVDLFAELEDVVSNKRLVKLLDAAWEEDSLATLKIIFNARSIHLGKAARYTFYRCAGWLAQHQPLTLIVNLRWLSRPVIKKTVDKEEKTDETDTEMVIVNEKPEDDVDDITRFDVKYGVSHGYWKDLLNILVLGVKGCLDAQCHPRNILYEKTSSIRTTVKKEEAQAKRHEKRDERHNLAIQTFNSDRVYRGLYLTVARLFAEQLKTDLTLLKTGDPKAKKNISLCAKWAPSHDRFHDKHTFIVSSIAELLYPMAGIATGDEQMDREVYLRHSRERYRRDVSVLRAHLDVVERKLSAKAYDKIEYSHVPSLAMNSYAKIFAKKDTERFEKYLDSVAEGKAHISGATLLPSMLVKGVRGDNIASTVAKRIGVMALNAQWKTLVQRIKDSGTLESSIAICDVSGSMTGPKFEDGSCPMDSAIGLSLLLAEVTAPPFGGHFITFSSNPEVQSIDLSQPLSSKVHKLRNAYWEMNTDFVAVFERLILPMAVEKQLSQEDMVKRVFVFSDMQFDQAQQSNNRFSSSLERIQHSYADSGYEMPELIFWNLAGGRGGYGAYGDDTVAPKPVTTDEVGTAIVSGYSQALLKMFLDNGSFEDDDKDEEENVKTTEEGDAVIVDSESPAKKRRLDPMNTLKKAISHKAYDPLVVVD
ncbi:hypothetical protein GGR51DRAFT_577465 [Nemania sp. FL0031]|nr:hypothetical protein GGR51DRAFT_577465 [Nemania sp. FL0031]